MKRAPAQYQQEAIEALLDASGRGSDKVNIRNDFVQGGHPGQAIPGPLHSIVKNHDERALDLFLLHKTLASAEPWISRPLPSKVWARLLGVESDQDHGAALLSRIWRRLDQKYGLIGRGKDGRIAVYTALREDGSRLPYTAPSGRERGERYFQIPFAYWNDGNHWYLNLSLAAKAMLLIASSLKPGFILPTLRVPEWYGISTETAQRGLKELRDAGLIDRATSYKQTPLAAVPVTQEYRYTLASPFGRTVNRSRATTQGRSVSA